MPERRSGAFWTWFERLGPLVMLLALILGFTLVSGETFATWGNAKTILVQSAILATCTLGMTLIMVSGGLDLSVGSTLAWSSVAGAATYAATGSPVATGVVCLLAGLAVGGLNGLLIAGLRMNPFIVTLGMMGIARGLARELADDSKVYLYHQPTPDAARGIWYPKMLEVRPSSEPWQSLGLPSGVFVTVIMIALMVVLMRLTVFGRHVYAIGSNEDSARLCGIRVGWTTFAVYALAGLVFGLAGLMQLSYDTAGDPTTRTGFELNVIAAVVIGGASLSGGVGSIMGSVVGALIMVVLTTGCLHAGVPAPRQQIIIGAIIVAAVALDMFRQGRLQPPFRLRRRRFGS